MTPDELTITIVSAIGGACLLSLLVALLVLANVERLRRLLRIQPLQDPQPTLPAHYVVPYVQPGPHVEPVGPINTPDLQRRTTYVHTSSDEHLPRNATPGPSNVPRTPPPAYDPTEAEEYGRFLRTVFRSPTPDLPLIMIPDSPEAPVHALLPEPNDKAPCPSTPICRQSIRTTLHTGGIRVGTPAHLCPLPDSDDEASASDDSSDYGGNEPVAEREDDDPLNPHGGDYEPGRSDESTSRQEADMRDQKTEYGWEGTSPLPEDPQSLDSEETRPSPRAFITIDTEQSTIPLQETTSWMPAPEPPRSNALSPIYSSPWHWQRETGPISMVPPDFDHFNQDPETFGWADEEEEEYTTLDHRDYQGYTSAPHNYYQLFPLPDSPTYAPPHPRCVQKYRPPQYSTQIFAGQNSPDRQPGGSNDIPVDPPVDVIPDPPVQRTPAERLQEAKDLADRKAEHIRVMRQAIEDEENAHDEHVRYWNLPNQNQGKGKQPDRGRRGAPPPPDPNWRRPLHERDDRWSLPRPPPKWRNDPPQPTGDADDDAPWLGIKPVMIRPPVPFEGKYDDIERFVGDCCMYFEVFTPYFQLHSQKVAFATSYFEGPAKDWWVHQRQEFWSSSGWDQEPRRFRYPSWAEFVGLMSRQFHNPATQDIHEKRMFDLRMGKGPAISYFNELEIEAKKAGRREDDQERGLMVKAVRLGVPDSYTNTIASSGEHIPSSYNDWKRRILRIYKERQKKWVFDQTVGGRSSNPPKTPSTALTTATSHHKTGGATSSPPAKPANSTPNTGGRDASGRWLTRTGTTYGGQGAPMDIGQMHAKGLCFRCHKQGHLSKDCLEKKDFHDIRSVQATTEPATGSKVEEIAKDLHIGTPFNPISFTTHSDTDSFTTHSAIPASNLLAFNVSSTTSAPVLESQNRYATLSVEEYDDNDIPLNGCNDASPARAEAKAVNPAGHEAESLSTLPLQKLGQTGANHRASSLCGETQSTKASGEKSTFTVTPIDIASLPRITDGTKGSSKGSPNEVSLQHEQAAQTFGSTTTTASVETRPSGEITARLPGQQRVNIPTTNSNEYEGCGGDCLPSTRDGDRSILPLKEQGSAKAQKRPAAGLEAASAQAVNRGHSVTCIEIPDEDDDTAFQLWLAKERTPAIAKEGAMSSESARFPTTPALVTGWCKPFEVDWTLHALVTVTGQKVFSTKGLVDSGCTSSAINCTFVQKHQLDTVKTAVPIIIYNADGNRNQAGDITKYVEMRMTISNHVERIDFAVTDLGPKDLYLGHDWLKHHNLVINWETGTIIFGRCSCVKNPFPLPDADPDDRWDEELEEGDTILAVNMVEELTIRAVHHTNDLAAAANAEKPKKTFKEMVPTDYRSFRDLFSKENFDELPERKPWDHAIELVPNAKSTLDCKVYPLNRDEQEQLDKFLDENLESGRITESKSPFASLFFFVKKKDGSLHPIQDYRKLNKMTIKNRYPLPLISELLDKLQGARYFTKLDVRWGYNNVRIREGDEHKAAFRMNRGLFEPTVMFFGLTNSPATFQWMMNDIFKDLISEGKVTIYLDDILIFTKDLDEHRHIVRRVLQRLRENKLFLKAEKCEFEVLETEYLGIIISEGKVRMDPVKLAGIAKWPTPTKKKELQSFLGFTNFYRKFIKNYSKVVQALTQLTGNAEWVWGAAQNQAFQQLKKQMAEDVILYIPN
ncbi:uncharacterized protein ARMOST_18831 [Armillaria ostoyae]|uniref:Reverse transcriptase n=1 Tax=Armillaria ostoyae TaxID=47428 RepID=A0A284S2U6_ARMOS|nr:uncharacterized protein ARMOST_18831 [Armillaria ostoyae]